MEAVESAAAVAAGLLAALNDESGHAVVSAWPRLKQLYELVTGRGAIADRELRMALNLQRLSPGDPSALEALARSINQLAHRDEAFRKELITLAVDARQDPAIGDLAMALADKAMGDEFGTIGQVEDLRIEQLHIHSPPPQAPADRLTPARSVGPMVKEPDHRPVRLFYSYSHRDEKFRERLEVHLAALRRQELIAEWHDHRITAGREWKNEIDDNLDAADVILLLVSPDFLASDYAYNKEFKRALERHKSGKARIVPIILRYSDWQETPIGELQALPPEGRPIAGRGDRAWMEVTKGLRQVIKEVQRAH